MRQFIRRHPFWSFYAAAFLIGLLAWIYLMTVELALQGERGPDYSAYGEFVGYRDATRAAHPILHHHGDSVLLYMQAAASKMPILLPMFSFPFAPTLAALLIVGIGWKRLGLRALLGLYRPIRGNVSAREGAQLYAILVGFLVTFVSSLLIFEQLFGDPAKIQNAVAHLGLLDWRTFVVTLLVAGSSTRERCSRSWAGAATRCRSSSASGATPCSPASCSASSGRCGTSRARSRGSCPARVLPPWCSGT